MDCTIHLLIAMKTPTVTAYTELQHAFNFFNTRLIKKQLGVTLPPCLFTLQRRKRTFGYFSNNRFESSKDQKRHVHEIALNPEYFKRPIPYTLATLVHEMVHEWQHHFGTSGRRGYHNKEWSETMKRVGLIPSDTGKAGGKQVGEKVSHYIQRHGVFDQVCNELLDDAFVISWRERFAENEVVEGAKKSKASSKSKTAAQDKSNRIRYECSSCGDKVWGKPALAILCGKSSCHRARYDVSLTEEGS